MSIAVELRRREQGAYGNAGGVVYYGQAITGRPFHDVLIIDPPESPSEEAWIDEVLRARMTPDATLRPLL